MTRKVRNTLCILFGIIIINCCIAIYIIQSKNNYDIGLYKSIYSEYNQKLNNIKIYEENSDINLSEDIIEKYNKQKVSDNVMGILEIKKINFKMPFLYETTESLMKIAPTRYSRPKY